MLGAPAGTHVLVGFRGKPVFVAAGGGLGPGVPGYTLIADESIGGDVYAAFAAKVRQRGRAATVQVAWGCGAPLG